MLLDAQGLLDLSVGAAFLGTGGGGDPYIGRLMVQRCLDDGLAVEIIDPETLPEDALVIPTAMMGAPTVMIEKLPNGEEAVDALRRMERHLGRKAYATMPIEIGGINSTIPLVVGARLGLPIVDADGMGRAFPELQMETFAVMGVPACPLIVSDEHGNQVLIEAKDNKTAEWLARAVTIRMGGASCIAEYSMSGADVKRTAVRNTLTLAMRIGRCLREAHQAHRDPFVALLELLPQTHYQHARIIHTGKITDVRRETRAGFSVGTVLIQGAEPAADVMEVTIQNENLVARLGGRVIAVVPDLVCIMDSETALPITTEGLRYGQRVVVIAVAVPPIMRTPEALAVFGPAGFGLDVTYIPVEQTG
jgi:DUF917 family protein